MFSRGGGPGGGRQHKRACEESLRTLLRCVAASECVATDGRLVKDCLAEPAVVSREAGAPCAAYHTGYFECRRSQLDMRARIRGPKFADHGGSNAASGGASVKSSST